MAKVLPTRWDLGSCRLIIVLLIAGLMPMAVIGADVPASIEMAATPVQVSVGMPVTITITYRWQRGWTCVHDPDPSASFHDLFVTSISPPLNTIAGTMQSQAVTLTVLPTSSGTWTLPQPTLTVSGPRQQTYLATAPEVVVTVGRAAANIAAPPPRPFAIRPAEPVHHPLWWLSLCALAACALWIGVMLMMHRKRESQRVQSAHELLQETLQHAAQAADGKEAAALTSLALRRFAGTVWKFDGPGSTAREAIQLVRQHAQDVEARDFSRLLDELEALRWTPAELAATQLQPTIDAAKHWGQHLHERLVAEAAARERERGRSATPTTVAVGS